MVKKNHDTTCADTSVHESASPFGAGAKVVKKLWRATNEKRVGSFGTTLGLPSFPIKAGDLGPSEVGVKIKNI